MDEKSDVNTDTPGAPAGEAAKTPFFEQLKDTGGAPRIDLVKEWKSFAVDKLPADIIEMGVQMLLKIEESGATYNVEVARHSLHHLEWWLALYHSAAKTPTTTSSVF